MSMKKLVALALAGVMTFSLAACSPKDDSSNNTSGSTSGQSGVQYVDPYAALRGDNDALSEAIYEDVLGEFNEALEAAKAETNVSKRYALMAIAEAKLLEAAVLTPLSSNGGNYAISRLAPYTASSVLYGNDSDRYYHALVTTEPIKTSDRNALKALWAEKKGTGTYLSEAKAYLEKQGYTLKDTYNMGYSSDPQTWDYLNTYKSADSEAICNTLCGLVEYDVENVLQPALAESWEVSEDGLTYTFKIRKGVKWVDSQGREVADLTAKDWVTGMQHLLDAAGGLEYLAGSGNANIVGVDEYLTGDITDFSKVGVKAVDDYTLQYTLTEPTSYFMTILSYNPFSPLCGTFYESKGGKYGADFDASADSYTYGKTPEDIAYCGPYLVTSNTEKNTIVFEANKSYWDKDNVNIKKLTWLYNSGEDALKAYNDTISGVLDGAGLNSSSVEAAKAAGYMDTIVYVSGTDATSFSAFYNLNRQAYANFNDENTAVSKKTEEQNLRSGAALLNVHFRRALSMAMDRATYNAQVKGEDLKLNALANSYTPGTFVSLEEDVTVDINGKATTFKAGTYYGAILQAQIDADGLAIKVWDPEADNGVGSSSGFDGWYNVKAAVEELNKAVEELKANGIEISKENPIYLDLPYFSGSESYGNRANAYKKNIEEALGGLVIINLVECVKSSDWYYAGYYADSSADMNYDVYDVSGWGPDYGDPATYLNTMANYSGDMLKMLGLYD